jgi:hypothetical protein
MTYSYTQISQYLTCPRRYRYRYLDGWKEKNTPAAMLFGRAFENALGAFFRQEDSTVALYREWAVSKNAGLHYSHGDTCSQARISSILAITNRARLRLSLGSIGGFLITKLVRGRRRSAKRASSSWGNICARCGRASTGVWRT